MIACPNKRTKSWKQLVEAVGEPTAYAVWSAKEGDVEDFLKSLPAQPTESVTNNPAEFTNHSGGAKGGDTIWENIGKEYGLGKQINYRPEDLKSFTKEQIQEVENAYQQAVKDLGRKPLAANTFAGGLVRRDYLQAKAADSIFAISTIVQPGQKDSKGYTNKTNKATVAGGTGYAVQMAINLGKPVYVFDQNTNKWFTWNNNTFVETNTPTLTKKFAGIGTREINEAGKQAIRNVYTNTFKSTQPTVQSQATGKKTGAQKSGISAVKLQEILLREVKSRQGYSLSMQSALELNEDKTDFKIPLWASPYADKFENLLSSIVNNNIVKQKFPGHSYVLGSEEGFKIKEGAEAAEELKKSGIVFTESFNPKNGLQPMRVDEKTGKILPAQIMVPFLFKDENGQVLDLRKFTKKDEEGRLIINHELLPKELLQLVGFRIPTQERNSMSSVEIVGFTPEASGDLILAPRDFTKQMGSDFDVDKLYTYMYNTFYKDGKLSNKFLKNKETIAKKIEEKKKELESIQKKLDLSKEDIKKFNETIDQILKNKKQFIEEAIERGVISEQEDPSLAISDFISRLTKGKSLTAEVKKNQIAELNNILNDISILNRSFVASNQNKIIDLHHEILKSNNPEIVSSVLALDSFGEFESLAKQLYQIKKEKGKIAPTTTILSDIYQRNKYVNATSGKNGVGNFSLDSTFNAVAQGKDLVVMNLNPELAKTIKREDLTYQDVLNINDPIVSFGDITSYGDISNKYTLRSQKIIKKARLEKRELTEAEKKQLRTKSTIIRYLQSTSVDNEKAQILDKINVNDETFGAIRALTMLGFEEKDIVAFLNQDIITEFVETIINRRSSLQGFTANLSEVILEELVDKYGGKTFTNLSEERIEILSQMSTEQLMDNIQNQNLVPLSENTSPTDYNLRQLLILNKFLQLTEVGTSIKKLQSAINTESKGVPKDLLSVYSKTEQIDNLNNNAEILNAGSLLGEYNNFGLTEPTTVNGYAAYYGSKFANEIFNDFFPYKKEGVQSVFDEILMLSNNQDASNIKKTELQKDIVKGIRSYLFSNSNSNLFTEDANLERKRLFIDTKTHLSLASILSRLSESSWYQKNAFLNKLEFNLNSNGQPSRVSFEASSGENFDERNIYNGFIELITNDIRLGKFNNVSYTSRMLAQELIMAAFLEGGIQGSSQYIKYIPIHYLKEIGFGKYLSDTSFGITETFGGMEEISDFAKYINPSDFVRQYFQNNPRVAPNIEEGEIVRTDDKTNGLPDHFVIEKDSKIKFLVEILDEGVVKTTYQHFVSIYDPKETSNYGLYEYNTDTLRYERLSVLAGDYGFKQYNSENKAIPIQPKKVFKDSAKQTHPSLHKPDTSVQPSAKKPIPNTRPISKIGDLPINLNLKTAEDRLNNLIAIISTEEGSSEYTINLALELALLPLPDDFKIEYLIAKNETEEQTFKNRSAGSFDAVNNILTLNLTYLKDKPISILTETFLHELVHAHSSRAIKDYFGGKKDTLSKDQISAIESLEFLQKQYIDHLIKKGDKEELIKFQAKFWRWKLEQNLKENGGTYTQEQFQKELNEKITEFKNSLKNIDTSQTDESISFSQKDKEVFYGAIKLEEFVTLALTNPEFQAELKQIEAETNTPWWSKFKELIINLLESLGLDINENSLLRYTVDEAITLVQATGEARAEAKQKKIAKQAVENAINKEQKIESKFEYNEKTITTEFPLTEGQDNALKELIDFVEGGEQLITLQGAAGTGKTSVIGYLQKYFGPSANFVYMAPTHAATAELASATVKTGNRVLPLTVKKSFYKAENKKTGKKEASATIALQNRLGYGKNIIVVDEVSMLENKDFDTIKEVAAKKGLKIIFMGDIKQIPEVSGTNNKKKQVSKAFVETDQVLLTEVKRTDSSAILKVLNALRTSQSSKIPQTENTESISYLSGQAYNNALVSTVVEDPENTVVISYTNKAVQSINKKVRKVLGREGDLQKDDIVVGYAGYNSKQIENQNIANSVRYIVEDITRIQNTGVYKIKTRSNKLQELQNLGISGVSGIASGNYYQLSNSDSFTFSELTQEDLEKNNKIVSGYFRELYKAKEAAKSNRRLWGAYYAKEADVAQSMANILLGGEYIYNPKTDRMEPYSYDKHKDIKKYNSELYVDKSIDFGHAVTIHKSQGSTVKNVFFDTSGLNSKYNTDLYQGDKRIGTEKQSLIYVALSRASDKLIVKADDSTLFDNIGPRKPLDIEALKAHNLMGELSQPSILPTEGEDERRQQMEDWELYEKSMRRDGTDEMLIFEQTYEEYLKNCKF